MSELISIMDAVKMGVDRLRLPIWRDTMDHIKIDIIDGNIGPWCHLFTPLNTAINGFDPVDCMLIGEDKDDKKWEIHTGHLPDSEEYKARVKSFEGAKDE